jgi:hypothetical protein
MTRFEYLSVLVSIILALGLAEVTVAWGRLLQDRKSVRFSWLHGFWSVFIWLLMVQFWWGFWNFRRVETWTLGALLLVVVETMILVVCAILLTPVRSASHHTDLRALYFANARPFFLLGALLMLLLGIGDTFVLGGPILYGENAVRLAGAGLALTMALVRAPIVHRLLPIVAGGLLASFVLIELIE